MIDTPPYPRHLFRHVGRWLGELLLVFLGAYAAFWLNNYQEHQEEQRRHEQILAALEGEVAEAIRSARAEGARQEKVAAEFRRALAAGEMPPLGMFTYPTDYSPTDTATLLQSGGYQLLDVKTLLALRNVESVLRGGLGDISHFQTLSDENIVPNLDQDISFFYDPATKKLRKRFAAFPKGLEIIPRFENDYAAAEAELLKQLQAERKRH